MASNTNKKFETFKLLEPIVSAISKTFSASGEIVDNDDGTYTIPTDDTLWLTLGFIFRIGGLDYTVTALSIDTAVTLKGAEIPPDEFELYAPFFKHGTILATASELKQKTLDNEKFPLIYLHEVTREKHDFNPVSSIDRTSDCEILFLAPSDFANWTNEQHWSNCIRSMRKLAVAFIDALLDHPTIERYIIESDQGIIEDAPKFGVYIADKGMGKLIFDDHLSGCKLTIQIPFQKNCC